MAFSLGLTEAPIDRRRSDGIDALRGVLALWVLFAHLVPWVAMVQGREAVPEGLRFLSARLVKLFQPNGELHPAVVAFIALSGYCIHRAGFRDRPDHLSAYAIRRSLRILPVFFIATAIGIGAFWLAAILDPHWASVLSGTRNIGLSCLLAKLTGVAAFVPSFHPCSFAGNAPLATVMVESWLYVGYGLAFAALVWRGREILVGVICAVIFMIGLIVAAMAQHQPMLYGGRTRAFGASSPTGGWERSSSIRPLRGARSPLERWP